MTSKGKQGQLHPARAGAAEAKRGNPDGIGREPNRTRHEVEERLGRLREQLEDARKHAESRGRRA